MGAKGRPARNERAVHQPTHTHTPTTYHHQHGRPDRHDVAFVSHRVKVLLIYGATRGRSGSSRRDGKKVATASSTSAMQSNSSSADETRTLCNSRRSRTWPHWVASRWDRSEGIRVPRWIAGVARGPFFSIHHRATTPSKKSPRSFLQRKARNGGGDKEKGKTARGIETEVRGPPTPTQPAYYDNEDGREPDGALGEQKDGREEQEGPGEGHKVGRHKGGDRKCVETLESGPPGDREW